MAAAFWLWPPPPSIRHWIAARLQPTTVGASSTQKNSSTTSLTRPSVPLVRRSGAPERPAALPLSGMPASHDESQDHCRSTDHDVRQISLDLREEVERGRAIDEDAAVQVRPPEDQPNDAVQEVDGPEQLEVERRGPSRAPGR